LTYDITNENSFGNIHEWVKQIEQNIQGNICEVLVGNKFDREEDRKVSYEEGAKLAKELNMQFFETSAKTNYNVNETFTYLTNEILATTNVQITSNKIYLDVKKVTEKKGCW
jgi:GTPase SAR1 family protein